MIFPANAVASGSSSTTCENVANRQHFAPCKTSSPRPACCGQIQRSSYPFIRIEKHQSFRNVSFHHFKSSATRFFPPGLRAAAFAPTPRPPPPSGCAPPNRRTQGHTQFQLVPQPENPSVPLARPSAPGAMLGFVALALRVWASANGRPLHSWPFRLRDKGARPPRTQ